MASEILRSATNKGYSVTGLHSIGQNKDHSNCRIIARILLHLYMLTNNIVVT